MCYKLMVSQQVVIKWAIPVLCPKYLSFWPSNLSKLDLLFMNTTTHCDAYLCWQTEGRASVPGESGGVKVFYVLTTLPQMRGIISQAEPLFWGLIDENKELQEIRTSKMNNSCFWGEWLKYGNIFWTIRSWWGHEHREFTIKWRFLRVLHHSHRGSKQSGTM